MLIGLTDELAEVIDDARARAGTAALMFLIVALIFIMVVKPFGGSGRAPDRRAWVRCGAAKRAPPAPAWRAVGRTNGPGRR
jgi:hypothetical protein